MHTRTKRIYIVALGVCLLVTLAIGSISAWALGDKGWVEGNSTSSVSAGSGANTLKVNIASNDASYAEDLGKAQVVVDVYKIASATKTEGYDSYDYTLDSDYDTTANRELLDAALRGNGSWEALAEAITAGATLHEGGSASVPTGDGATISGLDDGLYLVLAHGSSITEGLRAESPSYTYSFQPIIAALPTKDSVDGVINTANPGEWQTTLTVALKSERTTNYGDLAITKNVTEAPAEDATFVFHITGTTPAGEAYDNYAGITIPAGDTEGTVTVTHIPAGTQVTVTEEYAGSYNISEVVVGDKGDVIIADDTITFSVTNTPGDRVDGGHGVQNNFEYDKNGGGDWDWTPDPADKTE